MKITLHWIATHELLDIKISYGIRSVTLCFIVFVFLDNAKNETVSLYTYFININATTEEEQMLPCSPSSVTTKTHTTEKYNNYSKTPILRLT